MLVTGARNTAIAKKLHSASQKPLPKIKKHDEKYMGKKCFLLI